MNGADGTSAREILGALLLATVPMGLAIVPALALTWVLGSPTWIGVLGAVVVGGVTGIVAGPILAKRSADRLQRVDDDPLEDEVAGVATDLGIPENRRPEVRVVDADAATVAAIGGWGDPTLVVPTRVGELRPEARNAAITHALHRIQGRNVSLVTATLAPAILVELVALVAVELLRRRNDTSHESDRPRMLGEPERRRGIPWIAYPVLGAVMAVLVAPLWVVFALGDRALVSGGRRRADAAIVEMRRGDGLIDALTFAQGASGATDCPPTLDRLSLLPLADPATRRVRGTSRNETRIRIARLNSKR